MAIYELDNLEADKTSLRKLEWQSGGSDRIGTLKLIFDTEALAHGWQMAHHVRQPIIRATPYMHSIASAGLADVVKLFQERMKEIVPLTQKPFRDALQNWKPTYEVGKNLAQISVDLLGKEGGPIQEEFLRQLESRLSPTDPYRCFLPSPVYKKFQKKIDEELDGPDDGMDSKMEKELERNKTRDPGDSEPIIYSHSDMLAKRANAGAKNSLQGR